MRREIPGFVPFRCLKCASHLVWLIGRSSIWCSGCQRHIGWEEFERSPSGMETLRPARDASHTIIPR